MIDDKTPVPDPPLAERWHRDRVTLGGDEFLNAVIESVSGGDKEKRAWARAMVEHEDTAASFVADVRRALREVREARGLSIEAAAEQVGVTTSTLSRLETGATAKADLKLVARVALSLGVVPVLDFAARGTTAAVTVEGPEAAGTHAGGLRDVDSSSIAGPLAYGAGSGDTGNGVAGAGAPAGSTSQDPTALDRRIRDLEARIAAMEHPKSENSD